ncbi:MAG: hypothetical protein JJU09_14555 [Rhodobacteraceae bacterium]|jgi:hypothetical protein|nr:hypothetical protein [Paracoccaceae bacterium]TVR47421.1 MAG: hypothetical protein EA386_07610 [Paracoccaceae bacterium]
MQFLSRSIARIQSRPERALGFLFGLAVPLIIAGLYWAQTSGGLAGPLVDPRPHAFTVIAD